VPRTPDPNWVAWLAAVRAGDTAAWGRVLEHVRPYLTLLAAAQLGRRLLVKADPPDVVQDTFVQAHRLFHTFRGASGGEFVAWVEEILASRVAKLVRHFYGTQRRDVRLERELASEFAESSRLIRGLPVDPAPSPSRVADRREQAVRVAAAMQQLTADHRRVLVLRHIDGLKFPQIAERMGRTPDAVTKLWARAIRRLRALLEGEA
jgi:RNA polymerase sigma-70 factor (ECF subfamily)